MRWAQPMVAGRWDRRHKVHGSGESHDDAAGVGRRCSINCSTCRRSERGILVISSSAVVWVGGVIVVVVSCFTGGVFRFGSTVVFPNVVAFEACGLVCPRYSLKGRQL